MNINTSGAQLNPANFMDQLQSEVLTTEHGGLNICIEVTENAAMSQPEASIEALAQIRKRGIHVYLDDFGIGHSSMSYCTVCRWTPSRSTAVSSIISQRPRRCRDRANRHHPGG